MWCIKENNYTWRIFSIYTIEETSDYLYTSFASDESYINFIDKIKSRSINNFNIEVTKDDKILTLSTCYKDNKQRIVIHAKMI
jgi:sortase B